jgi:deazaflavin-dependent oxidoreductase (nitroreductase family)
MLRSLIKPFMAFHVLLIRISRGYLGTRFAGLTFLLLHTIGRRSGRHFVTPISYFSVDGHYFLVGSNWGRQHNAGWYYNLLARPRTTIEVRGREIPVEAVPAYGREYDDLWNLAVQRYPGYQGYKETTRRHIPIVVLRPGNH